MILYWLFPFMRTFHLELFSGLQMNIQVFLTNVYLLLIDIFIILWRYIRFPLHLRNNIVYIRKFHKEWWPYFHLFLSMIFRHICAVKLLLFPTQLKASPWNDGHVCLMLQWDDRGRGGSRSMPRTVAQEVSLASLRIDRAQARDFVTSVVCTCSFSVASL